MSFPWAINTNRRTYRKRDRARAALVRLRRRSLRLFVLLAVSGASPLVQSPVARAEPPPLPTALPQQGTVTSGAASIGPSIDAMGQAIANAMTINQGSPKVIIKWQSFNIGRDASVEFKQLDASSSALNHILKDNGPSQIFGRLKANGHVYLLNQNGFVFGNGAVVDTHSLIASTLNMSDDVFNNIGLTEAINQKPGNELAAFVHDATAGAMGLIKIEDGAMLRSAEGGRIMIFAPRIENAGEISTPGGQAVLAASKGKVYLANSDDENLRGLLVEVDTGGDVSNLGKIVAERGNVSMIGFAVNQSGIARATTSVNLNGSIRLVARDNATIEGVEGFKQPRATSAGTLTLGAGSLTEVAPHNLAETVVDAQAQPRSRIELMGREVTLESGARVVAPGGDVSVIATQGSDSKNPGPAGIVMESGSLIDVSGLDSAVLPMERNVIAVELFGSQLADSPLQRNGPLYRQTVYVDVRKGTPLANVKADIEKIERPLSERLAAGGRVSIVSEGDFAMRENATIDVSGGAVRYQDGFINTTKLVSQGRVVDIGDADPNRPYDGVFGTHTVEHRKWNVTQTYSLFGSLGTARFEPGYIEGKDAGAVEINARNLALQGTLRGEVTAGRYQRLPQVPIPEHKGFLPRPYDQVPLGGALTLGAAGSSRLDDFTLESLTELGAVGMSRLRVYANGRISVPGDANLVLAPGGELGLTAGSVDVQGDIVAPGGSVQIKALGGVAVAGEPAARLGATGSIDVAGQWVNDSVVLNSEAAPQDPVFINGGSVKVEAMGDLILEAGSLIDAGGGAQLQRNGKLKYGQGGNIAVASTPPPDAAVGESPVLRLDGELRAYSFDKGGSLSLTGAGFRIGDNENATGHTVYLPPEFFERGGFNAYNLTATHTGITLARNTDVRPRAMNRILDPQFSQQPTGTGLDRLGAVGLLPDYQRQPVSLGFTLNRSKFVSNTPRVEMETGSRIQAEPGATVALTSDTQLIVDGTIAAPAGDIRLTLTPPVDPDNNGEFDPAQAIRLGPNGQLLAKADFQSFPDNTGRGLRTGTVRDGGTVTVAAERGYFIASPGSRIDVSGMSQTLDIDVGSRFQPTVVNSAAGTIDLLAAEGMVLNGELRGAPGSGAGAAGGALNVSLDEENRKSPEGFRYPDGMREIILSSTGASAPEIGKDIPDDLNGIVRLDPAKIAAGGFDRLALRARSANADQTAARIALEGDVQLALARRLALDAPVLFSYGGRTELSAAYIRMGTTEEVGLSPEIPATDGSLLVRGQHVDLIGTLALRGFGPDGGTGAADPAPVRIESEGDIRLIGGKLSKILPDGVYSFGRLNSTADVTLRADQVYTATATDFTLSVTGIDGKPAGKITVQPGGTSEAPLSAGSSLTLKAENIEQHGTLRAPFGQIELDAAKNLVLGDGSVTSVSGSGQLVPFGETEFRQDWLYPLADSYIKKYETPPEKRVTLKAPQVTLAPGSTVDVTGGGDLLAREFLPGPGGSKDILDASNASGAFAIVPTQNNQFGGYDPFLSADSPVKTGDTIHLAGGGPILAGEYALLPAGYALLPGAYLVTPLTKTAAPVPGQAVRQYDGSAIVAGQRGVAGTNARDSLWSAFRIENGTQVRNRAEYLESRADNFFAAGGRLNRDAGRLVIDAGTALTLGGTLASNATSGRGSEVDILADQLAVVASRANTGGRVELLASELNNLNADSLLLGATRRQQGKDDVFDVRATAVTVESGTSISAPEVMLAAKEHVTVAGGATITAADGDRVRSPETIRLTDNSALARISSGEQVRVQRESSTGAAGDLRIESGATLDASRSITLDATRDTVVDGDLRTHNGSLSMAAARISLGEIPGGTGGLVLSNERLARLDARDLTLNSRSTIDLYGQISLKDLNHVVLDAAGMAGYRNAGQGVAIGADTIVLTNRSGAGFSGTPDGSGTLNLAAREVTLGEGEFAVRGFDSTTITATQQIIAKPETDTDTAVQLHVAGDLTMQTARLTAGSGADVRIDTQDAAGAMAGAIALTAPAGGEPLAAVTDLGAKLEIAATAIEHATQIELPSGMVTLNATGAGGVNIADQASINVAGLDLAFADLTVGSPGGKVNLIADTGDVIVGAARIDVSGAASGGDAGTLSVSAPNGLVQFDAKLQLAAAAREGNRAGSFALDAKTLANTFSAVNAALNTAGFNDARHWRLRTGNIEIAAGDTLLAHDLQIAADAGRIDVYGKIVASGEQAGQVALYAHDDVSLHGSSSIDAHATGTDEKGGSVTLSSTFGRLDLQAGAGINVAGKDATGTVHLRAEREATGDGVKINPIAADITGAERVNIEAYKTYAATDGSIDSRIATIQGETGAYMTDINVGQIKTALGINSDARFHLLPGVEIQSNGNLALNANWDLLNWRYGGEAGVLTLRAAGDLNLNQSLSDGVALAPPIPGYEDYFPARDVVQTGPSWSYRLAGGADLAGADPLSVRSAAELTDSQGNTKGNVALGSGVKVRTGTGDIEIAAGNDLKLTDSTAAIYTVGENRGVGAVPGGEITPEIIKELFLNGDFLHHGGDIRIAAGGDVLGADDAHQFINDWLFRVGGYVSMATGATLDLPVAWAVNVARFGQNIGALGGGDVTLTTGGGIDNLSVAIPTTGQPVEDVSGTALSVAGGGDLRIETGGDVRGGVFYLAKGQAAITAGGSVTKADDRSVYPVLALGDGQYALRARKDLTLESVINPTVLHQSPTQGYVVSPPESYFFTYTENSAVRLEAIAGDTVLRGNTNDLKNTSEILSTSDSSVLGYYPGSLSARSLQGDIIVGGGGFTLFPAPRGDLELLARGNIVPTATNTTVHLPDADPRWLPSVVEPSQNLTDVQARLATQRTGNGKGPGIHAAVPMHLGDPQPARIVAQTGVIGSLPDSLNTLMFVSAKQARISAGDDVRNLTLQVQHANPGDISMVEAGGSVLFPTKRDGTGRVSANGNKFEVAGPGQFYVIVGKDVDLGSSQGIASVGDQNNPALADSGASITVMAGMKPAPDYAGFIERYLVADDAYHERLAQFMTGLGAGATGVDAFKALPAAQQRRFILEVFFSELRESGVAAVESKDYTRGFGAIKTLFPAEEYDGDVKSFLSRIYTLDGGDINLIVPGGLVNAGVASASGIDKDAGKLGIVAQRAGDINAFVYDDFLVNASRVFALDGGDILVWSSTGNIDAGKGAKTALSIPPPKLVPDPSGDGNLIIEFPPSISGSGIRGAVSTPGRTPGDTYLIAPLGVINAGDAGIGSAGNLTIAATAVIGADNIQVGGIATGVPTDTGGLGAGLAGVGDIAATASKMAEDATRGLAEQRESEQGYLSVEVTGFGGGEDGGDVINLRNRRKPGAP